MILCPELISSCSQGPLPHTVPDFWRMVVECEVQVIIMASNETEGGKVGALNVLLRVEDFIYKGHATLFSESDFVVDCEDSDIP